MKSSIICWKKKNFKKIVQRTNFTGSHMKRKNDKATTIESNTHGKRVKKTLATGPVSQNNDEFEYNNTHEEEDPIEHVPAYSQDDVSTPPNNLNGVTSTQEQQFETSIYSYNYSTSYFETSSQQSSQDLGISPPCSPSPQKFIASHHSKKDSQKKIDVKAEQMAKEEWNRIKNDLHINVQENRDMYTYFNDLQAIANEYKIDLHFPELVVVGMQSDGKSSFVEALLGFQFNTIDTRK